MTSVTLRRSIARASVALVAAVMAMVGIAGRSMAGPRDASMAIDVNTGRVLHQSDADEPRFPASLTKMMTLYVVFGEIEAGRMSYATKIKISEHAAAQAPSKLDLDPGEEITAINAIKALITKSANDIAVALAEHVAGTEPAFAKLMTERARRIGMTRTTFRNASGLPDTEQVTTARDMITLGLRLHDDFPRHWALFSTRFFPYEGNTYRNHNTLLGTYQGVDGIKTGYTRLSGFNVVTSVQQNGKHVMVAVFGGATAASRNETARNIMNRALLQASPQKTRRPAPLLVAEARPVARPAPPPAARPEPAPIIRAAPQPVTRETLAARAPRPQTEPARAVAVAPAAPPASAAPVVAEAPPPPPPPPPAASRPDEADRAGIAQLFAEASALPPIEVASVRRVALLPAAGLPRPLPAESEAPVPPSASETPAPVGRAGAFAARRMSVDTPPLQTETSALAPGRPPSTLDAQARANATDEAPMPAMALASQGATPVPPTPAALRPAAAPAGDFQLQIGAFGSEGEATRALSATRSRTGDLLRGANEAALLVQKDNRKFYRARFTGFDAVRAQNTCAELKRQKIDCFVMRAE